ncbi:hypothetical protein [Azospirillum sp. TSA6c]|uniref:hypothetical protein n=1 Tax=Azospirillum sp. TSA6c TaxID=709813 RepID=UPI0011B7BCF6|nr:hypothetical protein [Azospirillum sp. TSA6c]
MMATSTEMISRAAGWCVCPVRKLDGLAMFMATLLEADEAGIWDNPMAFGREQVKKNIKLTIFRKDQPLPFSAYPRIYSQPPLESRLGACTMSDDFQTQYLVCRPVQASDHYFAFGTRRIWNQI